MHLREMSLHEIELWYKNELMNTFVEQERKPQSVILDLINKGEYKVLGAYDFDDLHIEQLTGYATFAIKSDVPMLLLDYLGVTIKKRNTGIGSQILKSVCSFFHESAIVLESELEVDGLSAAENELRRRRINFYLRNGFRAVYEMATCGLRWQALFFSAEEMPMEEIIGYHRTLYGTDRIDVVIPLCKGEVPPPSMWK